MFYTLNLVICFSTSDNSQILWKVNSFKLLTKRKSEGMKKMGACMKTEEFAFF